MADLLKSMAAVKLFSCMECPLGQSCLTLSRYLEDNGRLGSIETFFSTCPTSNPPAPSPKATARLALIEGGKP